MADKSTPDFTDSSASANVAQNQKVSKLAPSTFSVSGVLGDSASSTGLATLGNTTLFTQASKTAATGVAASLGLAGGQTVTTTPLSDTTTAVVGAQILSNASDASWQGNVLSDVDQATYNIRFFITDDTPISFSTATSWADARSKVAARKSTTIAQSGVTGLAIESLTIKSIPAPNQVTRSVAATEMTLVVKEPLGVSFFDMLAQAAAQLGISNFSKFYYFIEVTFKGYDTTGGFDFNPCVDFPNGGSWLYQVGITNIQVEANASGSTYTISCIPAEEDIYAELDLKLPFPYLPKGTTIGEMLNDLAAALNSNNLIMYGDQLTEYGFNLAPFIMNGKTVDPSKWKLTPNQIDYSDIRSSAMGTTEGVDQNTPHKAAFSKGMNITDVIEQLFVSCPDAQLYAKDVQTEGQLDKNDNSTRNCIVFRHEPSIDFGDYLPSVNQYEKKVTFNILSYFTTKPIVSDADITNASVTTNQKQKVTNFTESGYLVKRYDYMFTGLNTEVLNFDFKFNMNWSATLPYLYGLQGTNVSMTDQAKARPDAQDYQQLQSQMQTLVQKNNELKQKLQTLQEEDTSLKTNNASSSADKLKENAAKEFEITDSITRTSNQIGALKAKLTNAAQQTKQDALLAKKQVLDQASSLSYAEDALTNTDVPRMPVSIKQAPNPTAYGAGPLPATYTRDRSIYGAILDQIYGPVTADLQSIEIAVRGDPYWLGASNLERCVNRWVHIDVPRDHMSKNLINVKQVDYTYGDIMFLLAFKYPLGVNDDGSPIFKYNESFTGIYRVTQVTHTFSGGVFKQDISAARMALTDAFKALDFNTSAQTQNIIASNQTVSGQSTQ
jgi:hypothetical protein